MAKLKINKKHKKYFLVNQMFKDEFEKINLKKPQKKIRTNSC
jgi:hypothetical protein